MAKLFWLKGHPEKEKWVGFNCPGCSHLHTFPTAGDRGWNFSGTLENPTVRPSLLIRGTDLITDDEHARLMAGEKIAPRPMVCHSFITDGKIQFLDDCTHDKKSKTVFLPEVEK